MTRLGAFVVLCGLAGCASGASGTIRVDLVTDFVPGIEFVQVLTTVNDNSPVERAAPLSDATAFLRGQRVASVTDAPGALSVRVDLLRADGTAVATRTLAGSFSTEQAAVTVLITRSCAGVACGEGLSCIAGQCVPEECDPTRPLTCPSELFCVSGADCDGSALAPCATMECLDSVCLATANGEPCADGLYCNPALGCQPFVAPMDAGIRDAGVVGMDTPSGACADGAGAPLVAGSVCRPAAGACDVAEVCDGVTVECPADMMATGECRASTGACDLAETCSGTAPTCPDDGFQPNGTPCAAETCGGFGACEFSGRCDVQGSQSQTCTRGLCTAGVCTDSSMANEEVCSCMLTETCDLTDDDCDGNCDEGCRVPVYRFYHPGNGDHFYSRGSGTPGGYVAEGISFYLYESSRSGLITYYSCRNAWDFFLSTTSNCEGHEVRGVVGYVRERSLPTCDSVSLYRFLNITTGDTYYSRSSSPPSGYALQSDPAQVWTD